MEKIKIILLHFENIEILNIVKKEASKRLLIFEEIVIFSYQPTANFNNYLQIFKLPKIFKIFKIKLSIIGILINYV